MKKYLSILTLVFVFSACASKSSGGIQANLEHLDKLENGAIFAVKDNASDQNITYEALIEKLKSYDIIILGELHEDTNHHVAELSIVKDLAQFGQIDVAFEMLSTDRQKFIDKARKNKANIQPEGLEKALHWQEEWYWPDYKDLISYVFYSNNGFYAANLDENEMNQIYEGKKLKALSGKLSTTKELQKKLKDLINSFHAMSDEASNVFVELQMRKDRSMAQTVLKLKNPAVLVAGAFHASKDIGVPVHIKDLAPGKKVAVIALSPDSMSDASKEADFVFEFIEEKEAE